MTGDRKRCENCWEMVGAEIDVCPNCSNPFPVKDSAAQPAEGGSNIKAAPPRLTITISRPFKFILLFLLSFIAVLAFINAEGMSLNGRFNSNYLLGDMIFVSLVAFLLAIALIFIDYMTSN